MTEVVQDLIREKNRLIQQINLPDSSLCTHPAAERAATIEVLLAQLSMNGGRWGEALVSLISAVSLVALRKNTVVEVTQQKKAVGKGTGWSLDSALSLVRQMEPHARALGYTLAISGAVLLGDQTTSLQLHAAWVDPSQAREVDRIVALFTDMFPTPDWIGQPLLGGYRLTLPAVAGLRPEIVLLVTQ